MSGFSSIGGPGGVESRGAWRDCFDSPTDAIFRAVSIESNKLTPAIEVLDRVPQPLTSIGTRTRPGEGIVDPLRPAVLFEGVEYPPLIRGRSVVFGAWSVAEEERPRVSVPARAEGPGRWRVADRHGIASTIRCEVVDEVQPGQGRLIGGIPEPFQVSQDTQQLPANPVDRTRRVLIRARTGKITK